MSTTIDTSTVYTATSTTATTTTSQVMDKEDFLTLLVAQMENQDPLNPTDTTEYTSQLTQYSSLEQLMNLNDNVEAMMTMLSNGQSSSLDVLGKNVASYGYEFIYDGESIELGYDLDSSAEDVSLLIQQNGKTIGEVSCSELEAGTHYVSWDGLTENGIQASPGNYSVLVEATDATGNNIDCAPIICSQVTAINMTAGEEQLITENGELSKDEILAVFN